MCHTCGVFVSGRSCKPDYDLIANETSEAAQPPPALAEIAEGTSTEAVIAVGETITETLETIGDKDWFRVELAAGDTVEIELTGVGLTELRDPLLRLRDDQGRILAENDDIRFAIELDSRIIHTVETSGTYFIEADSYLSRYTGDYELSVDVALPPGPVDAIRGVNALEDSETLLVYLAQGGESYSERFNGQNQTFQAEGFNAYEREQIFSVFEHIETFADIDFELTNNRAAADLEIASSNLNGAINGGTLLGYFYFPTSQGDGGYGLLNSSFSGWGSGEGSGLDRGGFMYGVTLHEIGHGLGLAHPHDNGNGSQVLSGVSSSGSLGTFDLNQTVFTTLSYNDGFVTSLDGRPDTFDYGYAASFGTLDIAALQQLYGVNESHAGGNNVYRLVGHNGIGTGYEAIWDTGGRDWIVANGKTPSIIDLRAATLTLSPDGAGHVSSIEAVHGGFTIANGVVIEHARGGDGSDTITGNEVRNFLVGKAGADRLEGGAGDDVLTGGAGADRLSGGIGIDTASYRDSAYGVQVSLDGSAGQGGDAWGDRLSGIERVIGSEKADRLTGATDDDTLDGRDGDDMLRGGAGGDTLRGQHGDDTLFGDAGEDLLVGGDGTDDLSGGSGDDRLRGGAREDILDGGAGNDRLFGEEHDDLLIGGAGNDGLYGGHGYDLLNGGAGADRLVGGIASDTLRGEEGADVLDGGRGNDLLFGGDGSDRLYGDVGRDLIQGGLGDDLLWGGGSFDRFVFTEVGFGDDRIMDFHRAETISLEGLASGIEDLSFSQDGADTVITLSAGSIRLEDVEISDLGEDNFLF